ncbi:hypothetical protein FB446DRAFT_169821 [Lentinula raphanica]|nr:hypothetical protein FB446DRAFT_169821 [Lentinula raphanica]
MLRFLFSTFFSTFFLVAHADGIVDCFGTELDWYKTKVGETPCTTYERLRKICNSSFETGIMHTNAPPDTCMDEFGDCCCNSVAFALSMFCLAYVARESVLRLLMIFNQSLITSCQQGKGIDAGAGTYQLYLQGSRPSGHSCSPVVNRSCVSFCKQVVGMQSQTLHSLPTHIEDAVCDQGIKIIDDIYSRTFWANGAWIL